MLNYGPQNAWNNQIQSMMTQLAALQNSAPVQPVQPQQPVQQSIQGPKEKIAAYYNCIVDTK